MIEHMSCWGVVQVGSGTDPAEGAALAGVLLDRLAATACLTYATTHHAQLKDRPVSHMGCALAIHLTVISHCHVDLRPKRLGLGSGCGANEASWLTVQVKGRKL